MLSRGNVGLRVDYSRQAEHTPFTVGQGVRLNLSFDPLPLSPLPLTAFNKLTRSVETSRRRQNDADRDLLGGDTNRLAKRKKKLHFTPFANSGRAAFGRDVTGSCH